MSKPTAYGLFQLVWHFLKRFGIFLQVVWHFLSTWTWQPWASGAARMRPKKPWAPRNKLAKIFTGALDQFSTDRKTSVTAPPEQISWLRYRSQPLVPPWISRATMQMQVFITLSDRVNDSLAEDTRTWATLNDDNTRRWSEGAAISCWNCRCCSINGSVFRLKNEADLSGYLLKEWCICCLPY